MPLDCTKPRPVRKAENPGIRLGIDPNLVSMNAVPYRRWVRPTTQTILQAITFFSAYVNVILGKHVSAPLRSESNEEIREIEIELPGSNTRSYKKPSAGIRTGEPAHPSSATKHGCTGTPRRRRPKLGMDQVNRAVNRKPPSALAQAGSRATETLNPQPSRRRKPRSVHPHHLCITVLQATGHALRAAGSNKSPTQRRGQRPTERKVTE